MAGRRAPALHALRNVVAKLPPSPPRRGQGRYWKTLDEAASAGEAKRELLTLCADCRGSYPSAMAVIERQVAELVAHLRFPLVHRKPTRSTNLLERTFVEVRRRTKVIGRFPGETSALALIWAVLELSSRGWRGVEMTPRTVAEIERVRRGASGSAKPPATDEAEECGRRVESAHPAELRPGAFPRSVGRHRRPSQRKPKGLTTLRTRCQAGGDSALTRRHADR